VRCSNDKIRIAIVTSLLLISNISLAQTQEHKSTVKHVHKKIKTEAISSKSKPVKTSKPVGAKVTKDVLKAAPYLMKNDPDPTPMPHDPIEPGNTILEKVINASKLR
jgi:hypothetical protein